jgi:hypothetical protein
MNFIGKEGLRMKFILIKFLLPILATIVVIFIAINTYKGLTTPINKVEIVNPQEEIKSDHYIISEKMVMGKLKSKSQIVSMQQEISKTYTDSDNSWLGQRDTKLSVEGTYKLGLNTKDIDIRHIDQENGIVYIKLGKPIMVSLEIPYNEIEFDKAQGFFRLSMNEDEKQNFYKLVKKDIENKLMSNKEVLKQADLFNQDVVRGLLLSIPSVKSVVFE